jgi:hypothetical protein
MSPREQFDIGLVAVKAVLLLACEFDHDAEIFQQTRRAAALTLGNVLSSRWRTCSTLKRGIIGNSSNRW